MPLRKMSKKLPPFLQIFFDERVHNPVLAVSSVLLFIANVICVLEFYHDVAHGDLFHYAYVAYFTMLANALIGVTEFIDDQAFLSLCYLLDYCQLLLPLPCIATEIWMKYEVAPTELCSILAAFGIGAVLYFIICEYKRQDLADLAIITNLTAMFGVAAYNYNFYAVGAAMIFSSMYFTHKRREDPCVMGPQGIFNLTMTLFAILSLMSFEPSFEYLSNAIDNVKTLAIGE